MRVVGVDIGRLTMVTGSMSVHGIM